jgi:ribosome assembly protein 1
MQALYQYDPVVEVSVESSGEFTISCLGELHLELCLKALSENFAKCEVKVSPPLVPYRETVFQSSACEFSAAAAAAGNTGTEASGDVISEEVPVEGDFMDPMTYLPAPW